MRSRTACAFSKQIILKTDLISSSEFDKPGVGVDVESFVYALMSVVKNTRAESVGHCSWVDREGRSGSWG